MTASSIARPVSGYALDPSWYAEVVRRAGPARRPHRPVRGGERRVLRTAGCGRRLAVRRRGCRHILVRALAPGGWLLLEDFDWPTAAIVDPPAPVLARVAHACRTALESHGYDAEYGRRLPRVLRSAGLIDVHTRSASAQVWADPDRGVPQWELLVAQLRPALLAPHLLTVADLAAFAALCHDGDSVFFAPLMVSCAGRKPPTPSNTSDAS